MQLLLIRAAGFTATVDAYARDEGNLWFISLLGSQQAVRALWARLVKGETAYLGEEEVGGPPCWLAREAWGTWHFHASRLPTSGAYQGMLVPDLASYACDRQDFLLLSNSEEEAADLHYRFLNRRVDLPLHSRWAGWLWQRGRKNGEVQALESSGIAGYRCRPDPGALRQDITHAIRQDVLSDPAESATPSPQGAT